MYTLWSYIKFSKIKFKKADYENQVWHCMSIIPVLIRLMQNCDFGVSLGWQWIPDQLVTEKPCLKQANQIKHNKVNSHHHLIPWTMSTQMPPLGDPQRLVLLLYFSDSFSWREEKVRPRKDFYLCIKGSRATLLFPIFTHGPQISIVRRELFPGKFAEVAGSRWESSTVATVDTASALTVMSSAEL